MRAPEDITKEVTGAVLPLLSQLAMKGGR